MPHASLLILDLLQFVLLIIQVHGDCDTWRWWWNLIVYGFCLSSLCIREEFVVVTGIVVDEVDSFHRVVIVFLDLRDY